MPPVRCLSRCGEVMTRGIPYPAYQHAEPNDHDELDPRPASPKQGSGPTQQDHNVTEPNITNIAVNLSIAGPGSQRATISDGGETSMASRSRPPHIPLSLSNSVPRRAHPGGRPLGAKNQKSVLEEQTRRLISDQLSFAKELNEEMRKKEDRVGELINLMLKNEESRLQLSRMSLEEEHQRAQKLKNLEDRMSLLQQGLDGVQGRMGQPGDSGGITDKSVTDRTFSAHSIQRDSVSVHGAQATSLDSQIQAAETDPNPACDQDSETNTDGNTRGTKVTCPTCGKAFAHSHNLKRHERTHTEDKPFICSAEKCGFACARSDALKDHERRTHKSETALICPLPECGKSFIQESLFKEHQRQHAKAEEYTCEKCGRGFAARKSLERHHGNPNACNKERIKKENEDRVLHLKNQLVFSRPA